MARTAVQIDAKFRPRGRQRCAITVVDLSAHGCRVAGEAGLRPGGFTWLSLPTLESWYARIAWVDGQNAGLEFEMPLHDAVAQMIINRAEVHS